MITFLKNKKGEANRKMKASVAELSAINHEKVLKLAEMLILNGELVFVVKHTTLQPNLEYRPIAIKKAGGDMCRLPY